MKLIKRILLWLLSVIAIIIIAAIIFLHVTYQKYPPADADFEISEVDLDYYESNYEQCRESFYASTDILKTKFDSISVFQQKVPSEIDTALYIDFCFVPATVRNEKLLIVSSGIHGVEGFVGSAVQNMVMNELLDTLVLDNLSVLFIHGINPYGFKYLRRVTENNVDLNRNSDNTAELFDTDNVAYGELDDYLNPKDKANTGDFGNTFFYLKSIIKILKSSIATLRQAVLQGQYSFNDGLYFGGNDFENQINSLRGIIGAYSNDYEEILIIDLHTGYGDRGRLHLFPESKGDENIKNGVNELFEGYTIDWSDNADFYTVTGDFQNYVGGLFPDKKFYPMLFEYGTLNSNSTLGSIRSIHNMILENQGVHFGYDSDDDKQIVESRFMEMYYPSSEVWRSKVMFDSREIFATTIKRFSE